MNNTHDVRHLKVLQTVWSDDLKQMVLCDFEIELDVYALLKSHGTKALNSKGKKSVEASGALVVRYVGGVK